MQNVSLSNIIINLLAYELNNILLFNSNGQVRKAIKDLIAAGFKPFGPCRDPIFSSQSSRPK